jgi:hypothetical protein
VPESLELPLSLSGKRTISMARRTAAGRASDKRRRERTNAQREAKRSGVTPQARRADKVGSKIEKRQPAKRKAAAKPKAKAPTAKPTRQAKRADKAGANIEKRRLAKRKAATAAKSRHYDLPSVSAKRKVKAGTRPSAEELKKAGRTARLFYQTVDRYKAAEKARSKLPKPKPVAKREAEKPRHRKLSGERTYLNYGDTYTDPKTKKRMKVRDKRGQIFNRSTGKGELWPTRPRGGKNTRTGKPQYEVQQA